MYGTLPSTLVRAKLVPEAASKRERKRTRSKGRIREGEGGNKAA